MRLTAAAPSDADALSAMALDIWLRHYYPDILSREAIDHLWRRGYDPDALRREFAAGGVLSWIEAGDNRVGFVGYRPDPHQKRIWLTKLYVLPEFHGRGLGAFALREVVAAARELGAEEICLYVFRRNEKAIRAYRRAGFTIAREELSDAGGGFVYDDYVMSLRLRED